jgi:hypothetical protein
MTALSLAHRGITYWWLRLPPLGKRISRWLSFVLSDGVYLVAWPLVAGFGVPVSLAIAVIMGALHPGETFSFSLVIIAVMFAIASFSASLGLWLSVGYLCGDFLRHAYEVFGQSSLVSSVVYSWIPLLMADLLLAGLLVLVPLTTKALRLKTVAELKRVGKLPRWANAVLHALIQAGLVFIWVECVPTLIRPAFTWEGDAPPTAAVQPLQQDGWSLVVIAAFLAAIRIALEYRASAQPQVIAHITELSRSLASVQTQPIFRFPFFASRFLKIVFLTLMLSGLATKWIEAVELAVILGAVFFVRTLVSKRFPTWVRIASKVPLIIRLLCAAAVSYLFASLVVAAMWSSFHSFQPVIISISLSLFAFSFIVPDFGSETDAQIAAQDGISGHAHD